MSELDQTLAALRAHEGVQHVLVLGRDGLLIRHAGEGDLDPETVSAMIPAITSAAGELGGAAERGEVRTVVVRLRGAVAVVEVLADDLLLAILLRDGVGFAPLLRDLARDRDRLASMI